RATERCVLMDHRRVQRTLFRMQLDPGLAQRVRAGNVADLPPAEHRLLRSVDPAALAADRDGRRRAQFLANVSSEFVLSLAAGLDAEGFTASPEFHDAVSRDRSLPLAFGRYARRCSQGALHAMVVLEAALCSARRQLEDRPSPAPGEVVLAAWVSLVQVPDGTLELAVRLRAALDAASTLPRVVLDDLPAETLLVRAAPSAAPFRLREVEVEHVSPALAALLRAACAPRTRPALAHLAATAPVDLDPLLDDLLREKILVGFTSAG
ncbi:MAG: hypothetical protein ACREBE_29340, partial [bacterium]